MVKGSAALNIVHPHLKLTNDGTVAKHMKFFINWIHVTQSRPQTETLAQKLYLLLDVRVCALNVMLSNNTLGPSVCLNV